MEEIITECPTHMASQPGCYECVKESEYFEEHWKEIEEEANKDFHKEEK